MRYYSNPFPTKLAFSLAVVGCLIYSHALAQQPSASVHPFNIRIEDSVLKDLQDRLTRTRWADTVDPTGWSYGANIGYMKDLVAHWQGKYDWRAEERKLNKFDQFVTTIDGLKIHFIHQRSKEKDAVPLLLVHGWPGSFTEFSKIIGPLTDPVAHGGKAEDAFHVVCPSLPGYGFSRKPTEKGWNYQRMAEVLAKLMARLGYDRYGAQGGDWGSAITRWLATNDGDHCIGGHSNFPQARRPGSDPWKDVSDAERKRYEERSLEIREQTAYAAFHSTRPTTLGYTLNDSPVGLAAWIIDKFWAWSDHKGDLDNSFTKDELLTNIMVYWVTETMPSSVRLYYETSHPSPRPATMTPFSRSNKRAPLGYALFPKEITVPPRAWVERISGGELFHWTELPRGGHFAAMEQPMLLAEDIRAFFRKVR